MSDIKNLTDNDRFTIYVLWMHGYSLENVARHSRKFTGIELTRYQIRSVLRGTPYEARQVMSRQERQAHLDTLREHRMDNGRIRDGVFEVMA